MKILIVDDEPPARSRLRALVGELDIGEVVGEAANGADALRAVETTSAQVVLLDIRMPGMDGIEVARHLDHLPTPPAVIFTTAYETHALAAFEAHAVDYLLKPIRKERLAAALNRARTLTGAQLSALSAPRAQPGQGATSGGMSQAVSQSVGQAVGKARTHVSQHLGANVAGMGAGRLGMAILTAQAQACAFNQLFEAA